MFSKGDDVSSMDTRFANHGPQRADAVKALAGIVNAPSAEPLVGWLELPSRSPGTTLLKVIAAPLNPLDLLIASGTFHSVRHESPYVPGSECVGVVIDSDRFVQGTLVYAECHASPTRPGAFSTQVLVDDENILLLPDRLDPIQAAAIGNSKAAAYIPLIRRVALVGQGKSAIDVPSQRNEVFADPISHLTRNSTCVEVSKTQTCARNHARTDLRTGN